MYLNIILFFTQAENYIFPDVTFKTLKQSQRHALNRKLRRYQT